MAYAETTKVPFDRSVSEILELLRKKGAGQIGQMEGEDKFTLGFKINDRVAVVLVAVQEDRDRRPLAGPGVEHEVDRDRDRDLRGSVPFAYRNARRADCL